MQKVLLVDDKVHFHKLWMWGVQDRFEFLHAYTIESGLELCRAHPDLSAIVVDACMDGSFGIGLHVPIRQWGFNTRELITDLRSRFDGPIIASPCQWWHFQPMMNAGCTHYAWKWRVASLLKQLLV